MNIHEYQAKAILKKYGVQIQEGICVDSPKEAVSAAKKLNKETGKLIIYQPFPRLQILSVIMQNQEIMF